MHFVYVLQSLKDKKLYIGMTKNIDWRIKQHRDGFVESTTKRRPLRLIGYEAYLSKEEASDREKYLKKGDGNRELMIRFRKSLTLYSQGKVG